MNRAILDRQMFGGGGNVQYYQQGGQTGFSPTPEGIAKKMAEAFKIGGPQAGAQMRDRAIEMGADPSIANEIFDAMMLSTSGALKNNSRFALSDMDAVESVLPKGDDIVNPDEMRRMQEAKFAEIRAKQEAMYDPNAASNPNRQVDDRMKPTMRPEMGMAYGGMVDPRMRQPVGMAEGGMMVDEGIGALMAQEGPPPMGQGMAGPEVAMEQTLGAAAEGIGALDASQDYEEAINSVRGDQLPMEARYEELAGFVGPDDAAQTPESVLALVQPVMQMAEVDQGIGSIAPEAMGGEAPMTPEMAGGIMSNVPEAPPMEAGPPLPFNQGGVARDINDQVQYYADGGAVQYFGPGGEVDRDALYKTTQERYSKTLGQGENEAALSDAQKMAKSQMLFDIADTALRFASTPVGPGESIASVLAKSATESQLFPKIGQRAKGVQDLKTSQAKDQRSLNLAALQRSEQLGDAEVSAAALVESNKLKAISAADNKPLGDTYEIVATWKGKDGTKKRMVLEQLPLSTMGDRRAVVERILDRFKLPSGKKIGRENIEINKIIDPTIKSANIRNIFSKDGKEVLGVFDVNNPNDAKKMREVLAENSGAYSSSEGPDTTKKPVVKMMNLLTADGKRSLGTFDVSNPERLKAMEDLIEQNGGSYAVVGGPAAKETDTQNYQHPDGSISTVVIGSKKAENLRRDGAIAVSDDKPYDLERMTRKQITLLKDVRVNGRNYEAGTHPNFNTKELGAIVSAAGADAYTDYVKPISEKDFFDKFKMSKAAFEALSLENQQFLQGLPVLTDRDYFSKFGVPSAEFNQYSSFDKKVMLGIQPKYRYITSTDGGVTTTFRIDESNPDKLHEVVQGTAQKEYTYQTFKDGDTTRLLRFEKGSAAEPVEVASGTDTAEYEFREFKDGTTTKLMRFKKNDRNDKGTVIMSGEDAPEYDFREISDGGKTKFIRTNKATGAVLEVLTTTDTTTPSYMSVTLPGEDGQSITTTVDITTVAGRALVEKANTIRANKGEASVRKLSSERNSAQGYYDTATGDVVVSYDGKTFIDPINGEVKDIQGTFVPVDSRLTYDIYKKERLTKQALAKLSEMDNRTLETMQVPVYGDNGKLKLDDKGVPVSRSLTPTEIMRYKNTLGKVRDGTGFGSKFSAGLNNLIGSLITPKFFAKQFKKTTDGRMFVEALRVMGRAALSSSPRYAVADLKTVEKLFPTEESFFRNPETAVQKLITLNSLLDEEKVRLLNVQIDTLDEKLRSNAISKISEIEKLQSMIGPIAGIDLTKLNKPTSQSTLKKIGSYLNKNKNKKKED